MSKCTQSWEEQGQGRWPELAKRVFHTIEHKLGELAGRSWSLPRDGLSWEQLCCTSLIILVFYSPFCYLSFNHLHCHCYYWFCYYLLYFKVFISQLMVIFFQFSQSHLEQGRASSCVGHSYWLGLNTDILKEFHSYLWIANRLPKEFPSVKKNISIQFSKNKTFLLHRKSKCTCTGRATALPWFWGIKKQIKKKKWQKSNKTPRNATLTNLTYFIMSKF